MSIQVGGLISGLDTNALVEQMMNLERAPVDQMRVRVKELQNRQEVWQGVGQRLSSLESTMERLMDSSSYRGMQVDSSSEVVSASSKGDVLAGTWHVQVEQLAQGRVIAGGKFDTLPGGEFSLNGFTVQVDEGADVHALAAAINAAGQSGFHYTSTGDAHVSGTYHGQEADIKVQVEGESILVYQDDVLAHTFTDALVNGSGAVVFQGLTISLEDATNGSTVDIQAWPERSPGFSASVVDQRLVLSSDTYKALDFEDDQEILKEAGILVDGNEREVLVEGCPAKFCVNGMELERITNAIDDVIPGLEFVLQETGSAVLTAQQDTSQVRKNLEEFVSHYNTLLRELKGSLSTDPMAQRLQASLQRAVTKVVDGGHGPNSLVELGVASVDRSGRLEISTEQLDSALANPEQVAALLAGDQGLGANVKSVLDGWTKPKGFMDTRLETYDMQIKTREDDILRAEKRLERREERLWLQFAAMEKALSSLQNQGNWLAGQINNLPGYTGNTR